MRRKSWGEHLREQGANYLVMAVILIVVFASARSLYQGVLTWRLEREPVEEWIIYYGVEFVEEVPDGRAGLGSLRMLSDNEVFREVQLDFQDTLRCRRAGTDVLEFVSQNPDTSAFVAEPRPRRQGTWLYNADYPRGQECVVDSTVTATVEGVSKTFQVQSEPFVVEP